jgi:sugar lactone lactonase YvrE
LKRAWRLLLSTLAVCIAAAAQGAAALGNNVYWTDNGSGTVRVGNAAGKFYAYSASNLFAGESSPLGVALDPSTGRIYWADSTAGTIRVGNLDGTGAQNLFTGETDPEGLTIDPAAGRLYWTDTSANTIRVGNLNGTGAQDLFTSESAPVGVAIDPGGGKLYWADSTANSIRVGNLNGTDAKDLFTSERTPYGVAIDPAVGHIFWADHGSGLIRFANLDGSGTAANAAAGLSGPIGVADTGPPIEDYLWTDGDAGNVWDAIDPFEKPTHQILYSGEDRPAFLAELANPQGAGAPMVSGGVVLGSKLTCSNGAWSPDIPGAFFFRAPETYSYEWIEDGKVIPGATSSGYAVTHFLGKYQCRVTATNAAGPSGPQTSLIHSVVLAPPPTVLKNIPNLKLGTVKLIVRVPLPGTLSLGGKGVVSLGHDRLGKDEAALSKRVRAGKVGLRVEAKGRKKRILDATGRVRVRVRITYTPQGGKPVVSRKHVKLVKTSREAH